MALNGDKLILSRQEGDFKTYRYDTLDLIATVEGAGYFTNTSGATIWGDVQVLLEAGDAIEVHVWDTTIRTGTFLEKKVYRVSNVLNRVCTIVQADASLVIGPGSTVTQITNRSTGVTINSLSGQITTDDTSLAAGAQALFSVNNSKVEANDVVMLSIAGGQTAGTTFPYVHTVVAGAFAILLSNLSSTTADTGAMVINFVVLKGASS